MCNVQLQIACEIIIHCDGQAQRLFYYSHTLTQARLSATPTTSAPLGGSPSVPTIPVFPGYPRRSSPSIFPLPLGGSCIVRTPVRKFPSSHRNNPSSYPSSFPAYGYESQVALMLPDIQAPSWRVKARVELTRPSWLEVTESARRD